MIPGQKDLSVWTLVAPPAMWLLTFVAFAIFPQAVGEVVMVIAAFVSIAVVVQVMDKMP